MAQALAPAAAFTTLDPLAPNTSIRLDSADSTAALTRTITAWSWTLVQGSAGASLSNSASQIASLQVTAAGNYRIRLTVTDNLGASSTIDSTLTIGSSGGGGGGSLDWAAQLGIAALGLLAYLSRRKRGA
jgi:hypothetical protein